MKKTAFFLFVTLSFSLFSQERKNKKLRELSPDRPHQTESPITTDKKHLMLELDFINYSKEKDGTLSSPVLGLAFLNLKIGIHDKMDLEVITGGYRKRYSGNDSINKNSYFEDFTFRYKYNIVGNDSGKFALAIMPLVRTNSFVKENFKVQNGGLLVNAEWELMQKFGLGYTGGISSFSFEPFLKETELFSTVSFDYKLFGHLRQFIEVSYTYNRRGELVHNYSFDSGLTFTPKENWQLDGGAYYFVPDNKPFIFIGGSIRL